MLSGGGGRQTPQALAFCSSSFPTPVPKNIFGNDFAMAAPHTLKAPCIPAGDVGGISIPGGGNWKFSTGAALMGQLERAHVGARGELSSWKKRFHREGAFFHH